MATNAGIVTITVTDGWTGRAVAGARVDGASFSAVTDAAGTFQAPDRAGICLTVDIDSPGFLHRQTKVCTSRASVTLWPVESQMEVDATRAAVFNRDHMHLPYTPEVGFSVDLRDRADLVAVWQAAASTIGEMTGGILAMRVSASANPTDDGLIVSTAETPPACRHTWFTWDVAVAGFCWNPTQYYFVQEVSVPAPLIGRTDVALRALLYASILKPHDLPGVMNRTHPDSSLSPFEEKTLRMLSLRWPTPVTWPDIDSP